MKKRMLINSLAITVLSLTAFSFMNRNESVVNDTEELFANNEFANEEISMDFFYDVGPRFSGIKKGDLERAKSILDFTTEDQLDPAISYKSVKITIIKDERQTNFVEMGFSNKLTAGQKELFKSSNISTNFSVYADYMVVNKVTGKLEAKYFNPYLTIVPETQAEYIQGKDELIKYLSENSAESRLVVKGNKIRPAKLFFTITKKGAISNVKIGNHSGYPSLDKKMIKLVKEMPGQWIPAKNQKGDKVDQELVFSYGIGGC